MKRALFKTPRPKHPDAASEEERAEYWRDARKAVPRYARRGYAVVSMDEAHLHSYKNMLKTWASAGSRQAPILAWSAPGSAYLEASGRFFCLNDRMDTDNTQNTFLILAECQLG